MPDEGIHLTPDIVRETTAELRRQYPDYTWGRGEFRNAVFELLVTRFNLPWRVENIGQVPDFSDHRVSDLSHQLDGFPRLLM